MQLVVDGSDPQTVASATNTAASLVAARSSELLVGRLALAAGGSRSRRSRSSRPPGTTPSYDRDLHRARPHRRHPDDDHGDAHRDGDRARARARHARAAHRLAGAERRARVGKIVPYIIIGYVQMTLDPAGSGGWCSACRSSGRLPLLVRAGVRVHRGQPGAGPVLFDRRQDAAASHADVVLLPAAEHPVERLHVSLRGDAAAGAVVVAGAAADAFPAHRARHHAQRQRLCRRSPPSSSGSRHPAACW